MKLILRKNILLSMSKLDNNHQLALRSRVSSPTVRKYNSEPESINLLDTKVLCEILVNGVGMDKKDILNMKISDLFEILE